MNISWIPDEGLWLPATVLTFANSFRVLPDLPWWKWLEAKVDGLDCLLLPLPGHSLNLLMGSGWVRRTNRLAGLHTGEWPWHSRPLCEDCWRSLLLLLSPTVSLGALGAMVYRKYLHPPSPSSVCSVTIVHLPTYSHPSPLSHWRVFWERYRERRRHLPIGPNNEELLTENISGAENTGANQ